MKWGLDNNFLDSNYKTLPLASVSPNPPSGMPQPKKIQPATPRSSTSKPHQSVPASPPQPVLTQVERACPSPALPRTASSATTFRTQLCGLVACAGSSGALNGDIKLLFDWQQIADKALRNRCGHLDRTALSSIINPDSVMDKVYNALDNLPVPERTREQRVCYSLRKAIRESIDKLGTTLRSRRNPMPSCKNQDVSSDVVAFFAEYGIESAQ